MKVDIYGEDLFHYDTPEQKQKNIEYCKQKVSSMTLEEISESIFEHNNTISVWDNSGHTLWIFTVMAFICTEESGKPVPFAILLRWQGAAS